MICKRYLISLHIWYLRKSVIMFNPLDNALLCLGVLNVLLHGLGCSLLILIYRKERRKTTQQVCIINLAVIEAIYSFVLVVRDTNGDNMAIACVEAFSYGLGYNIQLAMFYLTLDRLLHVLYHIKYQVHWDVKKTWILMITTAACTFTLGVTFSCLRYILPSKQKDNLMELTMGYIPTIIYIVYFIFACLSYVAMFVRYMNSRRRTSTTTSSTVQPSPWYLFKSSKFSISILLVSSYLILMVLPSLTRTIYFLVNGNGHEFDFLQYYFLISSHISITTDALIYIFLQKHVRDKFFKSLKCQIVCTTVSTTARTPSSSITQGRPRNEIIEEKEDGIPMKNMEDLANSNVKI